MVRRLVAVSAALVAVVAAASCGSSPKPAAALPAVTFTFQPGEVLAPAVRRVGRVSAVRLVVISGDGRPHALTVQTPAARVRLTVLPGRQAVATLRGLRLGGRYRVVPDGATEPVVIRVG